MRFIAGFLFLLATAANAQSLPHAHVLTPIDGQANWSLMLDWEFSDTTVPPGSCASGWTGCAALSIPYNGAENDCYAPAMQTLDGNGSLILSSSTDACTVAGKTYPFHAGTIRTSDFTVGPGYIEIRAKIPNSSGVIPNWPAIWMVGQNWPNGGEIDIFEGIGGHAFATFHNATTPASGITASPGGDWTGWHVFGVLWSASAITTYYDGVQVAQVTSAQTAIPTSPMTLIINQAMGGVGGPTDANAVLKVDYVHVYAQPPPPVTPQMNYSGPGDAGPLACQ